MQQLPVRKEVQDFARSAKTLLSSPLPTPPLTEDELFIIAEHLVSMSQSKYPWSQVLSFKHAYRATSYVPPSE